MVAARAEVARLAGVGEQVIVSAGIAVDAGKAVTWVAAGENALERSLFDRAPQPARLAQLCLRAASRTATVGLRADCAGGKGRRAPMRCRLAHRLVFAASRNTFPSGRERAEGTRAAPTSALDWSGKVGSTDRREPALKKVSQSTMGTAFPSMPN